MWQKLWDDVTNVGDFYEGKIQGPNQAGIKGVLSNSVRTIGKPLGAGAAAFGVYEQGKKVFNPNDNILHDLGNLGKHISNSVFDTQFKPSGTGATADIGNHFLNNSSAPNNTRSAPPPSLNPEIPQTGTQTGGSNIYAGMSEQEIKDAYDKLRYGNNFDKARDYMKKGQGDPFDSTYNPSKLLVNEAGQKKAVEEGRKMNEAFFGPDGGRSREVSSPASQTPARGKKPFGLNFSAPLQNNERGSTSFDRDKEPVQGMPTYTDHRKRQQSLRTVQKRLQQSKSATLPKMSPVLKIIRFAEGTEGPDGYKTMYGHRMFDDMSQHPNNPMKTPWGTQSEATGAFQFMKPTWDEQAAKLGLKDFSPQSQVAAAVDLIKSKGIDPYMEINSMEDIRRVADALGTTWAGLPVSYPGHKGQYGRGSSYWGQGGKKIEEIAQHLGIMQ